MVLTLSFLKFHHVKLLQTNNTIFIKSVFAIVTLHVYAVWGLERSPRYDALSYTHCGCHIILILLYTVLPNNK